MKMVFTNKKSVSNTRSKKSIRQVQSAEKVGLTQVQSADTAVELTMPDFDQKRGATMPDFNQKRGATMFAFDLKKKDSRRIYVIAGLLLLHISCASAMQEAEKIKDDEELAPIPVGVCVKMGGYCQTRKTRQFAFRWVTDAPPTREAPLPKNWEAIRNPDGTVYYRNAVVGKIQFRKPTGGGDVQSARGHPELQYYKGSNLMGKPQKEGEGLKIYAGMYFKKVNESKYGGLGSKVCALRLWSGTLAQPMWLAQGHEKYRELKKIESTAQRIDKNSSYWVQRLEFNTAGERDQFIENLTTGLSECVDIGGSNRGIFGCGVKEIPNQGAWSEEWKTLSAKNGAIQSIKLGNGDRLEL